MTFYALGALTPVTPDTDDYWVAEDANVIGRVRIGLAVSIWFNATLRGDNELIDIGDGTNIQENTVIHSDMGFPMTIGANCTIGHRAMLHGCTIGDNSLIGMGATVLNGATIGRNCLIGANALITEGKVIPDNSLVMGSPGKVVRTVDAAGVQALTASALHYQQNFRRFKAELRAL